MTVLQELESLKNETVSAEEDSAVRRNKLEAIREKIKAGESTGDRLRDFALACHGDDLQGTIAKIFLDLESSLSGNTGQMFLIAEYGRRNTFDPFDHEDSGCFGPPYRPEPLPEMLTFGLLASDTLVVDMEAGTWAIPCKEYVRGPCQRTRLTLHAGNAFFSDEHQKWNFMLAKYGKQSETTCPAIIAGDGAVTDWLMKNLIRYQLDRDLVRRDIARMTLGLTVPREHWLFAIREQLRDSSFREALATESKIIDLRAQIEDPNTKLQTNGLEKSVTTIRLAIKELRSHLELAVELGIDPMRSEVLRINENFGRYWKTT
ncbi:hypothetical protein IT407_01510 [Candidatus Uhrbacteria bacterium]|nr:hypothetical protein [Candidatus Uhrbacteria bacterium]